jgi:predicted nucleic acid-binding protein
MTVRYLVDTDWAIHYLNDHPAISQRLDELKLEGLAPSVVSMAELYEGVYYSTDPIGNAQDLQDFLGGVSILGLDVETAQVFGRHRGRLRAARTIIGDFDLLIGATALRHDLTLLSNNRRHFELIEGLRLLSL